MASCAYCNTTIILGGKKDGDLRFCNADCLRKGALVRLARQLPPAEVQRYVANVHRGMCPECSGPGPVDVHTSYRVWSALFMTSWSSRPALCCQSCGTKRKWGDTAFSLFLGWWGLPWGVLVTPMQLGRNLVGMVRTPDPQAPSPAMENLLRLGMAAEMVKADAAGPGQRAAA
jgi:hypothetical protein